FHLTIPLKQPVNDKCLDDDTDKTAGSDQNRYFLRRESMFFVDVQSDGRLEIGKAECEDEHDDEHHKIRHVNGSFHLLQKIFLLIFHLLNSWRHIRQCDIRHDCGEYRHQCRNIKWELKADFRKESAETRSDHETE